MNIHGVVALCERGYSLLGEKFCVAQAACATTIYKAVKENSGHGVQLSVTHTHTHRVLYLLYKQAR